MEYLSLPFRLRNGFCDREDLYGSIKHSIGFILCTRPGSLPFDPEFGCNVWDKEYADLTSTNKADVRASIRNAIDRFEKRVYNLSVSFTAADSISTHSLGLTVKVSANFKDNGEEKKFQENYNLG